MSRLQKPQSDGFHDQQELEIPNRRMGKQELLCGTMVFVGTKRLLFRSWPNDVPEWGVEVIGKAAKKTTGKKGDHKSQSRR